MSLLDQFEKMKIRDKVIIVCFTGFILIAGFYVLVQMHNNNQLQGAETELQIQLAKLQSNKNEISGKPDPVQHLAELRVTEQIISKSFPDSDEIAELLVVLNKLGKEQNTKINQIKSGAAIDKQTYYEIPLEISLTSTYQDLLLYINKMENLQRFNIISKLAVQPKDGLLNVKLTASVYVYGPLPKDVSDSKQKK